VFSANDLKRLDYGTSRMNRQVAVIAFAWAASVSMGGGVMHLWLTERFAHAAHMRVWDVLGFTANVNQLYSGAVVRAVDNLDMAAWSFTFTLLFMSAAFSTWARARFYDRIKKELLSSQQGAPTDNRPVAPPNLG
jgi:hypothetical protein